MKQKVMAFGTFDYLHAGHENYLKEAAALGDQLIVVVARDRTAESIRGTKPDHNERTRLANIKELPFVTKAVLGDLNDKYKILKKYKPDIIALGYDQFIFTQQLSKVLILFKLNSRIVRLKPYKPDMCKSSLIRKKTIECPSQSLPSVV